MEFQRFFGRAIVVLLSGLSVTGALAQRITFHPSIAAGATHLDNVDYGSSGEQADTVTTFSATLPVERQGPRHTLSFRYEPQIQRYENFDGLDHTEHHASLDWQTAPSQRTSFTVGTAFSKSQLQAEPRVLEVDEIGMVDTSLTRRTDRTFWGASLRGTHAMSALWNWGGGLDWAESQHGDINEPGVPPLSGPDVEDRSEVGASLDVSRQLNRGSSIGAELSARAFDLETSEDEQANALRLTYGRRIGQRSDLRAAAGASVRTVDGSDDSTTEFDGNVDLSRSYRHVRLLFSAAHRPASGGHLPGTSTNSSVGVDLSGNNLRAWQWNVAASYFHRDPSNETEEPIDTAAIGGSVEWPFAQRFGLQVGATHAEQTSDDPDFTDLSTTGADIQVVYYPLGRAVQPRWQSGPSSRPEGQPEESEE